MTVTEWLVAVRQPEKFHGHLGKGAPKGEDSADKEGVMFKGHLQDRWKSTCLWVLRV